MNETTENKDIAATEAADLFKLDVRVTPITPRDNLIGFANITIADSLVIEGLKVCSGEKGLYVNMPSVQGKDGQWRDVVKPITAECRAQITDAVRESYGAEIEKMKNAIKAAEAIAVPVAMQGETAQDGKDGKAPAREAAEAKPSALEALKNGKEQAKSQPVKVPTAKEGKEL